MRPARLTTTPPAAPPVEGKAPVFVVSALATVVPALPTSAISPLPAAESAALTLTVVVAFSVRLLAEAEAQVTGLLTVIVPAPDWLELVSTMTELETGELIASSAEICSRQGQRRRHPRTGVGRVGYVGAQNHFCISSHSRARESASAVFGCGPPRRVASAAVTT